MTQSIRYVAQRQPVCDPRTGIMTTIWYLFMQGLMDPDGAASGNIDLEAMLGPAGGSSDEADAALDRLSDEFGQAPVPQPIYIALDDVMPLLSGLSDQIEALRRQINDIQQGVTP